MDAPMSALGHKQTPALQKGVSALPPIATTRTSAKRNVCFTPESGHLQRKKQVCASDQQSGLL